MPVLFTPVPPAPPAIPPQLFPTIIAEAGFTAASASVPAFTLRLDDSTFGLLGHDTLGVTDTWTDLSAQLLNGTVNRPGSRQQGPQWAYQAGTAAATFRDASGALDPANPNTPYLVAGVSQVRPMIPFRYRATYGGVTYPLWRGFADSWTTPAANPGPHYEERDFAGTDAFKVLGARTIAALATAVGSGELSGARINRILQAAGWYDAGLVMQAVAAGDSLMQPTTMGDTALNLMQVIADSEVGELYVDASGRVTFRNRNAILTETRSTVPQAVFGDAPGTVQAAGVELPYYALGRADDDTTMFNDIQGTIAGSSVVHEVQDTASIVTYLFPRTYARTDLMLTTEQDAANWAGFISGIAGTEESRFDTITIHPSRDPGNLFPQVLGREIGDRIQVWRRPPSGAVLVKDLYIRGISHTFDAPTRTWETTWTLQSALHTGGFLTLGDPVLGQLGSYPLNW